MSEKRCGDCKYFVAFRNYNYETCTNDTITEYCELLQNEDTYDRDKGDEIWNDVFDDCPLKTGYVSTESAILLVKSKKEVRKQFDNYVRISCEEEKKLQDENEQLRQELQGMDELLQSYRKTIKHDAELLADASKNGYLPPLNDYVSTDGWICGCCKHFHTGVKDRCDKNNNWVLTDGSCQDFER